MGFASDRSAQLCPRNQLTSLKEEIKVTLIICLNLGDGGNQPQKHADSIGPASSIPNMRSVLIFFLQPLLSLFLQPWRQREEGKS